MFLLGKRGWTMKSANREKPERDNSLPPSKRAGGGTTGVTYWKALAGLRDPNPMVRALSAQVLLGVGSPEALKALREANAVEDIVSAKMEIVHAITELERQLSPQAAALLEPA